MENIRIEAMVDILQEVGVSVTTEQAEKIVKDFVQGLEMEREMSSYAHVGRKEDCDKCKRLERQIKDLEKENEVFRNSVKTRRGASAVWIENDVVRYEK